MGSFMMIPYSLAFFVPIYSYFSLSIVFPHEFFTTFCRLYSDCPCNSSLPCPRTLPLHAYSYIN